MRGVRNTVAKGFTLVEILIVVVILGILAAIVVPQFTNAANEARGGNVATQESTMTSQIELWAARNNGAYPDLGGAVSWDDMVTGGYFKAVPTNPFATGTLAERSSIVAFGDDTTTLEDITDAAAAAAPADGAWLYNIEFGLIKAARGGN